MVGAQNRKGLERLCRYIARPPLAKDRLERLDDGDYRLRLKTAWSDGTTSLKLSGLEVMERLASIVPPPRANQVHCHGLFAPRSKWRKEVLPKYRKGCSEEWQKRHLHRKLVRADRKAKGALELGSWLTPGKPSDTGPAQKLTTPPRR